MFHSVRPLLWLEGVLRRGGVGPDPPFQLAVFGDSAREVSIGIPSYLVGSGVRQHGDQRLRAAAENDVGVFPSREGASE